MFSLSSPQDIYCKYCCIIFEICVCVWWGLRLCMYILRKSISVLLLLLLLHNNFEPLFLLLLSLTRSFGLSLTLLLLCCVHVPIVCSLTLPRCVIKYIYIFYILLSWQKWILFYTEEEHGGGAWSLVLKRISNSSYIKNRAVCSSIHFSELILIKLFDRRTLVNNQAYHLFFLCFSLSHSLHCDTARQLRRHWNWSSLTKK